MLHESKAILHLIFAHYDEALLLFCRSAGSSISISPQIAACKRAPAPRLISPRR